MRSVRLVDPCELVDKHSPVLRSEMIVIDHHPKGGKAKTLANTHVYTCLREQSIGSDHGRTYD